MSRRSVIGVKNFKLGFRNRSLPEQLNICQRVGRGIVGVPEDQCASAKLQGYRLAGPRTP